MSLIVYMIANTNGIRQIKDIQNIKVNIVVVSVKSDTGEVFGTIFKDKEKS